MSVSIKLKHSSVQDKAPLATDLVAGELALNINENSPAAYIKDSAGNVVKLAGSGALGDVWKRTGTELEPVAAGDSVFTSGDVKVGGTTAAPNISLNANGDAGFTNRLNVGDDSTAFATIVRFARTDTNDVPNVSISDRRTASAQKTRLTIEPDDDGTYIRSNNTATTGRDILLDLGTANHAVKIGGTLPASPNISLYANGSATFAGNVTAANITSDIRFKENITPASSQLDDVKQLSALLKNWDWNDQAPMNEELRAQRFLGLVAQEAEKVCPHITYTVPRTKQGKELTPAVLGDDGAVVTEATYEELDDSYKALKHDVILMKLLGTVGELIVKNEALEAKVTALEGGAPAKARK